MTALSYLLGILLSLFQTTRKTVQAKGHSMNDQPIRSETTENQVPYDAIEQSGASRTTDSCAKGRPSSIAGPCSSPPRTFPTALIFCRVTRLLSCQKPGINKRLTFREVARLSPEKIKLLPQKRLSSLNCKLQMAQIVNDKRVLLKGPNSVAVRATGLQASLEPGK